jgi:hypothetical protein
MDFLPTILIGFSLGKWCIRLFGISGDLAGTEEDISGIYLGPFILEV